MSKIKAILSDSDGTLVDTLHLIRHGQYEASKQYLIQHGIPVQDIPDYPTYEILLNRTVGGRTRDVIEATVRLLYKAQPHHLENINFDELYALLDPIQDKIALEYVKPYPGLANLFASIGRKNIKLAIFSSGNHRMIVRNIGVALPELGMSELFKDVSLSDQEKLDIFVKTVKVAYQLPDFTVVTSDDTTKHKPDPQGLQLAMQRLGVSSHESLVLGDHTVDMQTAMNAGVDLRIAVTHGFDDRSTLEAAGALKVVDSLSEVIEYIEG